MAITFEEIIEETRRLPSEAVSELVDRIWEARHGRPEDHVKEAWRTELHRRLEELKSGKINGIPLEESLARARKAAGL